MRQVDEHLAAYVGPESDALLACTLTRYGGLFEEGSEAAVERLLLCSAVENRVPDAFGGGASP
jgi:hypothetical protein